MDGSYQGMESVWGANNWLWSICIHQTASVIATQSTTATAWSRAAAAAAAFTYIAIHGTITRHLPPSGHLPPKATITDICPLLWVKILKI